jgi:hypothetical protein
MYYDTHRQHSYAQASGSRRHGLLDIADMGECLLDAIDAAAPRRPEREAQRVMDELLRECLKRKPLV